MAALLASMIHDAPTDSDVVLELEQLARRQGTGLAADDLDGCWQLNQTWSREGTASSSFSIGLLRGLQACLMLERQGDGMAIANQVSLGAVQLRFDGTASLKGRQPMLMFSFDSVRLKVGSLTLVNRSIPAPAKQRQPFFALIAMGAERGWLCARGKGGGLALWIRTPDNAA